MDEQDIELLKTLIDTQNITKTAKKLYTTQSSLTKRIQKMEQDLGCQLFIRSRKGILPTPAAEGIFPEIENDKVDKVRGMDIIFVTTAKTDEEARHLLSLFNMPFAR